MAEVGGKKYSYTRKGMAAAKKASAKSGKPMRTAKPRKAKT